MIGRMEMPFLDVRNVRKSFGMTEALRGITFTVQAGELFGLLGPNGAGKSTLLSIIACLSDPNAGEIYLDGTPLVRGDLSRRPLIGIGTQDLAVYGELTARENLAFFGKLYGLRGGDLAKRIDEVLEMTALGDRADQRVHTFSGGMKRRLNLGVAIVHRPRLLLLDEPTTGVDPQSRNHIFERVRDLNAAGLTVIYTSHYMEEVQSLCPRIAIVDHGKAIACDTLPNLLKMIEGTIQLSVTGDIDSLVERLRSLPEVQRLEVVGTRIVLTASRVNLAHVAVINAIHGLNVKVDDVQIKEPTLEQVFLHLTEKTLRD